MKLLAMVTARVDIYALGAVGYFLLTREPPFTGSSAIVGPPQAASRGGGIGGGHRHAGGPA